MAKFSFRLQQILNLKMQLEDNMKNELGKSIRKLENEKRIFREIDIEREENIQKFNTMSAQGIVVGKLKEHNIYISALKDRMEKQKENVNQAEKVVDNNREKLIKAMQEREILEKLKERKYEEYSEDQLRTEQKLNDEFNSFKFKNI